MEEVFRVEGQVQGVGFRAWAAARAAELGLGGWVRNCRDGAVEVAVRGTSAAVARFRALLEEGPPHARVARVTSLGAPTSPVGAAFEIRRG